MSCGRSQQRRSLSCKGNRSHDEAGEGAGQGFPPRALARVPCLRSFKQSTTPNYVDPYGRLPARYEHLPHNMATSASRSGSPRVGGTAWCSMDGAGKCVSHKRNAALTNKANHHSGNRCNTSHTHTRDKDQRLATFRAKFCHA